MGSCWEPPKKKNFEDLSKVRVNMNAKRAKEILAIRNSLLGKNGARRLTSSLVDSKVEDEKQSSIVDHEEPIFLTAKKSKGIKKTSNDIITLHEELVSKEPKEKKTTKSKLSQEKQLVAGIIFFLLDF